MEFFFRRNYDNVLLRCLEKYDAERVLHELHDGLLEEILEGIPQHTKVLRAGYYWPQCSRIPMHMPGNVRFVKS
jgi:hypothetical protein